MPMEASSTPTTTDGIQRQPMQPAEPRGAPEQGRWQCYLCSRTYERQDHLSRHLKSHDNERNHRCPDCGKGYNRADLLNRHRAAHVRDGGQGIVRRRTEKACKACIRSKTKCDDGRPCKRCHAKGLTCLESEQRSERTSGVHGPNRSPTISTLWDDDEAAQAMMSLTHEQTFSSADFDGSGGWHNEPAGAAFPLDSGPGLSDFFEQIMMPGPMETQPSSKAYPPDVSNFTLDVELGPLDFDFGALSNGLALSPTAQIFQETADANGRAVPTPQSDVQLRSEAFKKSPWSWNHWIPPQHHSTFSEQAEINVVEQRVQHDDQLTPGNEPQVRCALENEARDRMIRVVTQIASSQLAMPSFPNLQLLEDLIGLFLLQERSSVDAYIHAPSFNPKTSLTELLIAMVAAGATYVAVPPVWKMGMVLQEVVRLANGAQFERDNSTTRDLQPLQVFLIWLDIGVWSGFRRKTEIANSFLQSAITMLTWSNALDRIRYKDILSGLEDDVQTLSRKWTSWVEQEELKRVVVHAFIHDSQVAMAYLKNSLLFPAQLRLPVPAGRRLWSAPDAIAWRDILVSQRASSQAEWPSLVEMTCNIRVLDGLEAVVDKPLCMLVACHARAYEVFQFRQQKAMLLVAGQEQANRDRWLAHLSRQKELAEDLGALAMFCELQSPTFFEAAFTVEYLQMSLHVSLDDIQLFSGRLGEEEARRVFPALSRWAQDQEARTSVWHAGQVLRVARSCEKTRLRNFHAVAVYHCALTLFVYGMIRFNVERQSRAQTPMGGQQHSRPSARSAAIENGPYILLDAEDEKAGRAFRQLGHGVPCLQRSERPHLASSTQDFPSADLCLLSDPNAVMLVAADVLKNNFPTSVSGLPPLVENLTNLMLELARVSAKTSS